MKLKIKKLSDNAVTPTYSKVGDAALDLTATSVEHLDKYIEYGTSLCLEIPTGYVGLIFPRSSVTNSDLMLKNSVGVIDSNYRGEVKFRFFRTEGVRSESYRIGDRIGQLILMPIPTIEIEEVKELSVTNRGQGGYGSTGR